MNFDNVYVAMLTLFEVAGLELWFLPMWQAMDAPNELGKQPQRNQNWPAAFYFVIFIIVGAFIIMNLFVGAVVDKFNDVKDRGKNPFMTESQASFVDTMRLMLYH